MVEMTALLDGRMRREATVAGEPALEITILADLSKLPTTSPWLSDWLSAAWCPGNLWDRCVYFTNENWSRRADSNRGPADYESFNHRRSWRSPADPQELVSPLVADRWTDDYSGESCKKQQVPLQSESYSSFSSPAHGPPLLRRPQSTDSQPTQGFLSP